jgi:hypothetical protein
MPQPSSAQLESWTGPTHHHHASPPAASNISPIYPINSTTFSIKFPHPTHASSTPPTSRIPSLPKKSANSSARRPPSQPRPPPLQPAPRPCRPSRSPRRPRRHQPPFPFQRLSSPLLLRLLRRFLRLDFLLDLARLDAAKLLAPFLLALGLDLREEKRRFADGMCRRYRCAFPRVGDDEELGTELLEDGVCCCGPVRGSV